MSIPCTTEIAWENDPFDTYNVALAGFSLNNSDKIPSNELLYLKENYGLGEDDE